MGKLSKWGKRQNLIKRHGGRPDPYPIYTGRFIKKETDPVLTDRHWLTFELGPRDIEEVSEFGSGVDILIAPDDGKLGAFRGLTIGTEGNQARISVRDNR